MMMLNRHPARWLFVILTVAIGVSFGHSVSAKAVEPTIGPVPVVEGRALQADDLPDLIPLYGDGDEILGYVRAEEAFVELFDSSQDVVALGVYEKDGVTLIGHEIPGKGFVAGTKPITTSRSAAVPPPLE
jgi:hypothetical protein